MSKTHVHHIVPRSRGGTNDPGNLTEIDFIEHAEHHAKDFLNGGPWFDFRHAGWPYLERSLREAVLLRASEVTREKNLQRETPCALGCKHSEESKRSRSEKLRGPNNPRYGKKTDPAQIKKAQEVINNSRYLCLVTGKVSTLGPLVQWQRAREIHPSLKVSISTLLFFIEKLCLK